LLYLDKIDFIIYYNKEYRKRLIKEKERGNFCPVNQVTALISKSKAFGVASCNGKRFYCIANKI
jgi:hypothetical protein